MVGVKRKLYFSSDSLCSLMLRERILRRENRVKPKPAALINFLHLLRPQERDTKTGSLLDTQWIQGQKQPLPHRLFMPIGTYASTVSISQGRAVFLGTLPRLMVGNLLRISHRLIKFYNLTKSPDPWLFFTCSPHLPGP